MVSHFLNISKLIIIYIIIVIIQILYISYKKNKVENAIHSESYFNNNNKKKLTEFINKTLKERLELLNSHKLSYEEWIDYNNKYNDVYFDKTHKYYIMLYEIGKDEKTIIPPSNGVGLVCSFLILSGLSISLVFFPISFLYLFIK